jgi:hypothetical protein
MAMLTNLLINKYAIKKEEVVLSVMYLYSVSNQHLSDINTLRKENFH